MDTLTLPISSSSRSSISSLPTTLTGSTLAVADFAMTIGMDGTVYMAGGQSSSGELVDLSTIGKWVNTTGWISQQTKGDVPSGRVGATFVAHPTLDLL
jgi:hypothetical protein